MSNPLDAVLSSALAIRLNLQISLSSLPIVEEWMDIHLTRWLDSVPLPPEMPMGHTAHFAVALASDLSSVAWRAHGDPSGFVPKMARYLEACRISNQDVSLLDQMGEVLEPRLVGSWISVAQGKVLTGWHFADEHPFSAIEPLFGDHPARHKLSAWFERTGADKFSRFAQTIGEDSYSDIEFPVPGVSVDDQLAGVVRAFTELGGVGLPEPVQQTLSAALSPEITVAARIREGEITKLSVISPGLGNDVISELCTHVGVGFHAKLPNLLGALGAQGADRVEYARLVGSAAAEVDLHLIPTDAGELPLRRVN